MAQALWNRLMAPDGDATGGSGGDGGDGGGDDGDKSGDGTDLESVVSAQVNKAVSAHFSRFKKTVETKMAEAIEGGLAPITQRLEKLQAPAPSGDDATKSAKDIEELKRAESRIAELERKNQEAEQRAAETDAQRKRSEERTALTEALRTAGVDSVRTRAAVALLYNEDQRIGRGDDENIVFRVQKPGYVEEITLEDGITEWLKTDEGKSFLPPRGAAGSGATGSQAARRRTGNSKQDRIAEARRNLMIANGMANPE